MNDLKEFIRKTVKQCLKENSESSLNDNFWKWFGNSKVVDEQGSPMICYHGTNNKFDKFNKGTKDGLSGKGIYFSEYPLPQFGENQMKVYLKIDNPTGEVVSCWKLSFKERVKIVFTGRIWLSLMSFNKPLTPSYLAVNRKEVYSHTDDNITLISKLKTLFRRRS